MKNPKAMTYKELENEVIKNRGQYRTATLEKKRELINRDHDLMVEMDSRWNKGGKSHD
jgi:hypothetical protein